MRGSAILRRWIDVLAGALLGWREGRRARRALMVAREPDGFVVRCPEDGREAASAALSATAQAPADLRQAARNSLVVLELPPDQVVVRRITVPLKAREFLPGIVRNQIERLSPWPPEQAVYGFDAAASAGDAATLDVRVLIASRPGVDAARTELAAVGLAADRIVAREPGTQSSPLALWSRLADASQESLAGARRLIGLTLAGMACLSLGASVWAFASAASIRAESEEVAARAGILQRQLHAARAPESTASLAPAQRAWNAKENAASFVLVIEALSRALPDSAYLTELSLTGATLRMIGWTRDAPPLIAALDRSGHLADVHFAAPTTRGPDGQLFRFHIEARVEPRLDVTE